MGDLSKLLAEIAQVPAEDVAASWREPLKHGDVVGRYQIRREIGRGGFGAVYEAFDPQLGRVVALKALKPGRSKHPVSEEWIQKEAEAVAKLDHPGIVTIFDVGTCPAGAYLVMELLRGETLAKRIEKGPLPVDEALRIAEQMAEGLAHAHSRGVLHRDLKPANVFVCEDGRVKLLDFGLAHLLGTEGSSGAGTPAYMAPEQEAGAAVDERADVWAAAMVVGEMLTGRRPVERTPSPAPGAAAPDAKTELMWEAPKATTQPGASTPGLRLGGVPRPVAKALGTALSEDPSARPRDGNAWLSELRSARQRVDRPRRLRRVIAFAVAFLVLGLIVAGFATWRIWERQIPGGRPTVAVADFANETGDSELDGVSGLLITSLEQGTQLRVLTRGRMLDVLKQLGKEDVRRIDEPMARAVGRESRANALLLASIRKLGATYVVEMRALDPLHDEYVFTTREQASAKEAVFQLVDRLAATTRLKLGARSTGPSASAPPVASITTASVRAWDFYFRSREALDHDRGDEALALARSSVEADPDFALGHYQLATATIWFEGVEPTNRARVIEVAERFADRLPEKERLSVRAWRAGEDKNWEEALRIRDEIAQAHPLDKEALAYAGDVRFHLERFEDAVPYFERALQLDPGYELVRGHLLAAVPHLHRPERHLDWLRREASSTKDQADSAGRLRSIAHGLLVAGSEQEALATWRRATALDGLPWPPMWYANYLSATGRATEAESTVRAGLKSIDPKLAAARPRVVTVLEGQLILALASQGRLAEAREAVAASGHGPSDKAGLRRWIAMVEGSPPELRLAVARGDEDGVLDDPLESLGTAIAFLTLGRPAEAGRYATLTRNSPRAPELWEAERLQLDMAEAWAQGNLSGAEASARKGVALAAHVRARMASNLWLGLILAEKGDCASAIGALEIARAQRMSFGFQLDNPVILQALAGCYERTGNVALALERNSELLRLWERADPDIARLVQAKAMRERLAAAPGVAGSPR